jgi:hypothetical protein
MSNQARHGDGGAVARLASIMWEREDDRGRRGPARATRDYPGICRVLDDYDEREAQRRADDSEAALRRSVARLKRGGAL